MTNLAELLAQADAATQGVELNTNTEFKPITPGAYDVQITGAEGPFASARTDPTNPSQHGQYLKIELTITGPSFVGRKLWMNNNIICVPKDASGESRTKSQKAMAIGAKERKVMLDSIGKTGITVAQELVGASFTAEVVTEPGTNGYKDKSVVKSIRALGSVKRTSVPSAQTQAAPDAPAPTSKKNFWE